MSLFMKLPFQIAPVKLFCECRLNCQWRSTIEVRNRLEGQTDVHQIAVKIATLDSLELQRVGFIKIDVEGHELAVLSGAAKTLVSERPNILIELEERHCPGTVSSVRRFLQELGYEGHFLFHGQVSPITDFREALHQNPEQLQESGRAEYVCNFMFIPNERAKFLAKRLRQADSLNLGRGAAIFDVNWAQNQFEKAQPRTASESGTKSLTERLNASGSSDRGEAQA